MKTSKEWHDIFCAEVGMEPTSFSESLGMTLERIKRVQDDAAISTGNGMLIVQADWSLNWSELTLKLFNTATQGQVAQKTFKPQDGTKTPDVIRQWANEYQQPVFTIHFRGFTKYEPTNPLPQK